MENKEYKNIFTIEAATLSRVEDARLYAPKRVLSIELILVTSSEFDEDELAYVLESGKQVKIIVVE